MLNPANHGRRASAISGLVVFLAVLILARAAPLVRAYTDRFRAVHGQETSVLPVAALVGAIGLLFVGIWKWPRATAAAGGLALLILVVTSGNAAAFLIAATLLGLTLLAGDLISRLFRGREAEAGELAISIAAGAVIWGGSLLLLGEAGLAKPIPLVALALVLLLARRRRIPQLARQLRAAPRRLFDDTRAAVSALWLAIVAATIAAGFLGALRPDVSFDALAYHLPEVRDFARLGRVEPLANVPETFLWHNYETFLGAGFLAGGERVVRLVHLGIGLAAFASAVALGRRLGGGGAGVLVLLALAASPAASGQLKQTYADLPAALFLTAAAAEIASSDREPRRLRLGGFLFGGAIVTKIFALWGAVALFILLIRRRRGSPRGLLAVVLCAALSLAPWFGWSQSRSGFFVSPYSDPLFKGSASIPPRLATDLASSGVSGFFRLPYDRTFRQFQFVTTADSFPGFLPLLLLLGALGWGRRRLALFGVAALAAVLPWYALSSERILSSSIRFLIPLYPLYAVFTALGLARLTENFRGRWGAAAAISLAVLSIALPAQLFSAPFDAKVALGRISREEALSAYLPAYPLWRHVRPEDRVLLIGEWDRYHCPAQYVARDRDIRLPVGSPEPEGWRQELRRLRITHIVLRADQRKRQALLKSIEACIEEVGRHAGATLYRANWEGEGCSGPAATKSDGESPAPPTE